MPANDSTPGDSEHTAKVAAILSIQPDDSQPLTQFSREQLEAYFWAVKWLHDFNLHRRPKPNFSDEVLARLSDFHGTQMSDHFHRRQMEAPEAITDRPTVPPSPDPEAEWDRSILQGMKRMDEDLDFRASVEKHLS